MVCSGFGKVFKIFPEIQIVLKVLCAAYLVYLSYQILGSFNKIKNKNVKPIKFYQAALFQILNPKAWSIQKPNAENLKTTCKKPDSFSFGCDSSKNPVGKDW